MVCNLLLTVLVGGRKDRQGSISASNVVRLISFISSIRVTQVDRRSSPYFNLETNRKEESINGSNKNIHINLKKKMCNVQPSQATANPVDGKACSSTKCGLLRYIVNPYSVHKVSSF